MTPLKTFVLDKKCVQLFVMSAVCVVTLDPALASDNVTTSTLGATMKSSKELVFGTLSPMILGVGCVIGCGYSIVKSSIMGVLGSLGITAIAGYCLNAIQTGSFLKLLS